MPHVLAVPVAEYAREQVPYVKLHRLTAAAEVLTRFCAAVALADLLSRSPGGEFPPAVRRELLDKIEAPTFGKWAGLLREAVREVSKRGSPPGCVVPELPSFVVERLLPLLGSNSGEPAEQIIPLRNLLAHSGRLAEEDERRFVATHPRRFEELILSAAFFADVHVLGSPAPGQLFLLHGLPAPGSGFAPFPASALPAGLAPSGPDQLLLLSGGRCVDLFPLHAYGEVFRFTPKGREELRAAQKSGAADPKEFFDPVPEASPSGLLYFRRGAQDYLEFTALSPHAAHSQEGFVALERFKQVFRLEEWRRREEARRTRREFDFKPWQDELLQLFVGRDIQVREAEKWVSERSGGLLWLEGQPGVGKSAFMAKLSRDFFPERSQFCKVVHFFRATDPRCSQMKFLENALSGMGELAGPPEPPAQTLRGRIEQFSRLLKKAVLAGEAHPGGERPKIVFLVDGLDEIAQTEPEFAGLVLAHRFPGVVWVCAGRGEAGFGKLFREAGAHLPFEGGHLPTLTDGDVRELLDQECGALIYQLIARDRPDAPAGGNANPFLHELVERSGRLPLYLRLLIQDLRDGLISFREGEERKLPKKLQDYYERILDRMKVGDVAAVLTPVFCLLAKAKAPLTLETVRILLARDRILAEGGTELLARVLELGHSMLRRSLLTERADPGASDRLRSRPAYSFNHDSFRAHLLSSATVANGIKAAAKDFFRLALNWRDCREDLFAFRYVLRHGPEHLLEAARWRDLAELLQDGEFLQAKVDAGLAQELAGDLLQAHGPLRDAAADLAPGVISGVLDFVAAQETSRDGVFTLDSLHSWLAYSGDRSFYVALLEAARSGEGFGPEVDPTLRRSLGLKGLAYLANLARRDGDLEGAAEIRALVDDLEVAGDLEQLGRVEYDIGYIHFLQGDLDEAEDLFTRAAEHSRDGGDPVGEWVSRCVHARIRFLREDIAPYEFRDRLLEARGVFDAGVADARKGPLAVRWQMNVKAHLFEAALAAGDEAGAEKAFEELKEDAWIRQHDREAGLRAVRGRLAMLRRDWDEAVRLLRAHLKRDLSVGEKAEARSRDYLDLGIALQELGRTDEATEVWQRGLACPDHLGNGIWKERIRARMERL
jgi:tetratricopeptide (TPR) repeat protein